MAAGTPFNAQIINRGLSLQGKVSAVFQHQDIETGMTKAHYQQVSASPVAAFPGFPEKRISNVYPPHIVDQVAKGMSKEEGPFSVNKFLRSSTKTRMT